MPQKQKKKERKVGVDILVLGFGGVAIAIEFNVLGGTGVRRQYGGDAGVEK